MGVRARGASALKTLAAVRGSGVHSNERHVHHFQIASLELERSRRARERQAAVSRIATLDARLLEIDALIRRHQEALGGAGGGGGAGQPRRETRPAANHKRRTLHY